MLVRHGHVVAEGWWTPYDAKSKHELYSLSKSFYTTAVGLAVAEGKLSVEDRVVSFFPDDVPSDASENLKAMRVRDLLTMSTGHTSEARLGPNAIWTKAFLAQPVVHTPGEHFMYNTPATYMLSAIVQKQTGQTVLDYLKPRLFEPLGIEEPTWGNSPQGVSLGGYGLNVRTEDIAKFGQLYLQKGMWNGKQLIPAEWIRGSHVAPSLQWTGCQKRLGTRLRCYHSGVAAAGIIEAMALLDSTVFVLPKHDAVIAITAGTKDMQRILNLIWDQLEPAFVNDTIAANPADSKRLQDRLYRSLFRSFRRTRRWTLRSTKRSLTALIQTIRRSILSPSTRNAAGNFVLSLKSGDMVQSIECGTNEWIKQRSAFAIFSELPIAACGNWTAEDQFTAKICLHETPFCLSVALHFSEDKATFDVESNVGFGPTKRPQLVGHRE